MTDKEQAPQKSWFQKGNRKVIALVAGTVTIVGGAFGVQALADSNTYAHMKVAASDVGGWHSGGRHGGRGHHGGFSRMSEAEIEAKVERMVKHLAIEIDATDAQQEKITTLATALAADLKPIREQMREARQEIQELLVADTIDRAALEQVRATSVAEAERISKNLVDAAADVAELLTAEQRQLLNERLEDFRPRGGGRHRG